MTASSCVGRSPRPAGYPKADHRPWPISLSILDVSTGRMTASLSSLCGYGPAQDVGWSPDTGRIALGVIRVWGGSTHELQRMDSVVVCSRVRRSPFTLRRSPHSYAYAILGRWAGPSQFPAGATTAVAFGLAHPPREGYVTATHIRPLEGGSAEESCIRRYSTTSARASRTSSRDSFELVSDPERTNEPASTCPSVQSDKYSHAATFMPEDTSYQVRPPWPVSRGIIGLPRRRPARPDHSAPICRKSRGSPWAGRIACPAEWLRGTSYFSFALRRFDIGLTHELVRSTLPSLRPFNKTLANRILVASNMVSNSEPVSSYVFVKLTPYTVTQLDPITPLPSAERLAALLEQDTVLVRQNGFGVRCRIASRKRKLAHDWAVGSTLPSLRPLHACTGSSVHT